MKKVITYGSYDLLHYGHINFLKKAKELGDYLIVGVTSDDYDRTRGKINIQQSLAERINAVRELGIADEIIVEEYEGQKIDDIKRYGVDIFTVGEDWKGTFDYLSDYCEVIYMPRTEGISSSKIRSDKRKVKLGIIGDNYKYLNKVKNEDKYVNGVEIIGICTNDISNFSDAIKEMPIITNNYDELLEKVDSVFVDSQKEEHYEHIKKAVSLGKNVLCESPIAISYDKCEELYKIAEENNCIIMDGIRTAYSTAYARLLLLIKAGKIGEVVSVDVNCTSMEKTRINKSFFGWGANAVLPIFQILGTEYKNKRIVSKFIDEEKQKDAFTKVAFTYDKAVASLKVAEGAKSESELIITGTKGYIYVPAPWWKTDYFEIKYENSNENKRYFYQLDGEGIRYELVAFARAIQDKKFDSYIEKNTSLAICKLMEDFHNKIDLDCI